MREWNRYNRALGDVADAGGVSAGDGSAAAVAEAIKQTIGGRHILSYGTTTSTWDVPTRGNLQTMQMDVYRKNAAGQLFQIVDRTGDFKTGMSAPAAWNTASYGDTTVDYHVTWAYRDWDDIKPTFTLLATDLDADALGMTGGEMSINGGDEAGKSLHEIVLTFNDSTTETHYTNESPDLLFLCDATVTMSGYPTAKSPYGRGDLIKSITFRIREAMDHDAYVAVGGAEWGFELSASVLLEV